MFKECTFYPIGIARKEPIKIIRKLPFLVILSGHVKEVFGDINIVFSVRDLNRTVITVVRCVPVKRFGLDGIVN
jgi:hypothetical protein